MAELPKSIGGGDMLDVLLQVSIRTLIILATFRNYFNRKVNKLDH